MMILPDDTAQDTANDASSEGADDGAAADASQAAETPSAVDNAKVLVKAAMEKQDAPDGDPAAGDDADDADDDADADAVGDTADGDDQDGEAGGEDGKGDNEPGENLSERDPLLEKMLAELRAEQTEAKPAEKPAENTPENDETVFALPKDFIEEFPEASKAVAGLAAENKGLREGIDALREEVLQDRRDRFTRVVDTGFDELDAKGEQFAGLFSGDKGQENRGKVIEAAAAIEVNRTKNGKPPIPSEKALLKMAAALEFPGRKPAAASKKSKPKPSATKKVLDGRRLGRPTMLGTGDGETPATGRDAAVAALTARLKQIDR